MDIDYLEMILDKDSIIKYINMKTIEKNSPLYYAKIFLEDFIDKLDSDSPFYFPLLSIDSDKYFAKINNNQHFVFVPTYGFKYAINRKIKRALEKYDSKYYNYYK